MLILHTLFESKYKSEDPDMPERTCYCPTCDERFVCNDEMMCPECGDELDDLEDCDCCK